MLINLCCRPCFIWGSITIITVWTNMIIINVCKFFYLLIECFLCCKLIQICAFILQGIEITLHRCIVVRISCFAHALCHIYRFAEFGKCFDVYCEPWSECKIRPSLIVGCDSSAFRSVRIARSLVMLRSVMLAITLRSCKSIIVQL